MAINVSNSFVGTPAMDGGVYFRAPLGTKMPETPLETFATEFEDHGAVGEDGFSVTPTRNTTDIRMMGGDVFRTVQNDYGVQVVLTFLEDDTDAVIKTTMGDTKLVKKVLPDGEGGGEMKTVYYSSDPLPISSHLLKAVDGDKTNLYLIERGQVVSVGERRVAHSDVTRTEVTISCYKPKSSKYKGANVVELRYNPNSGEYEQTESEGGDGGAGAAGASTVSLPQGESVTADEGDTAEDVPAEVIDQEPVTPDAGESEPVDGENVNA